jgi:hypothetical protein
MMYCDAAHQPHGGGAARRRPHVDDVERREAERDLQRPLVQFALNLPAAAKAYPDAASPILRAKPLLKRLFLRRYPAALLVEKQEFAGFPNEAAAWLGEPSDWLAPPFLGIETASLETGWADCAIAWKLINVEYFLRHLA